MKADQAVSFWIEMDTVDDLKSIFQSFIVLKYTGILSAFITAGELEGLEQVSRQNLLPSPIVAIPEQ